ncbi:hypothetical protein G5C60_29790 [Streptomyces sp. HC44]|uniref:Uncharacterized protein n=1 Tax=Streptomyces scabichelini TaxID=2711217 RepID=A0A6G4VCP5_9ACTN|nr:hypothetical protein [Streptomyces scabichelini]NGO11675.1 hypothetical protein [Streptomyces scabichelini]
MEAGAATVDRTVAAPGLAQARWVCIDRVTVCERSLPAYSSVEEETIDGMHAAIAKAATVDARIARPAVNTPPFFTAYLMVPFSILCFAPYLFIGRVLAVRSPFRREQ